MVPSLWRRLHPALWSRASRAANKNNSGFCWTSLGVRLLTLKSTLTRVGVVLILCSSRLVLADQECWTYTIYPNADTAMAACVAAQASTSNVMVPCDTCGGDYTVSSQYGQRCFAYFANSPCVGGGYVKDFLYPANTNLNPQIEKSLGSPKQCAGNPCNPATGNKFQMEEDYRSVDASFSFARSYNSLLNKDLGMGFGWSAPFHRRLELQGSIVQVRAGDGRGEPFSCANNSCTGDPDSELTLTQDASGYTLTLMGGSIEHYDTTGKLLSESSPSGQTTTYSYDTSGRLSTVTNIFGLALTFGYNASNHVSTIVDPAGHVISYSYDANNNLTRVDYPDSIAKLYFYENITYPNHLTGISYVDSSGIESRLATYAYYYNNSNVSDLNNGKAIRTEHAQTDNGAPQERFTLAYDSDTQTTVTDPVNMQEVMTFSTNLGVKNLVNKVNQSDGKSVQQVFDGNNSLLCRKNEERRVTLWTYNGTNQKLSQTEGLLGTDCNACLSNPANCNTTGVARITTYEYLSPTLDLPRFIRRPSVASGQTFETELVYDDAGHPNLPTQIIQRGFTPTGTPVSRSVGLSYNAFTHQISSINGPRTDVSDVTTLEYYECTTGGGCGQLKKVTNALGHITTYDQYDANGRLLQMTDPNGLVTTYSYDPRGRVKTITRTPTSGGAATTQYSYTPWGDVSQVIDPDGVALNYQYDAAHDLRFIVDATGNYIHYRYDLKGNRTADNTYDSSGALMRAATYAYDLRNHLQTISSGSITGMVNDAVGNLTSRTDGNQHVTAHQYDALNRLFRTVNALNQNTDFAYDANDRIASVTAPNNLATQYSHDDLGNRLLEVSPDRGNTVYTYDAAGNVRTVTNQLQQVTTYLYDALNRVTSRQSSVAGTPAYTYIYDTCRPGALCAIRQNGADHLAFGYDGLGRRISQQDLTTGLTTGYSYTPGGRLASITYPNNIVVSYTYNNLGNVTRVNALNTALADNVEHHPFGPLKSFNFGNGMDYGQRLDYAYRPWLYGLGYRGKLVYYDDAGNVQELNDSNGTGQSFAYDALDQLTYAFDSQTNSYGQLDYSYLANGRRRTKTQFNQTINYLYYGTNHLSQYGTDWLIYYGTGSVRSGSALGYLYYDGYEHLTIWGYAYNAFDQRTRKVTPGGTTVFAYGPSGELLYESNGSGSKAYVYLGDRLLGRIDNGDTIYYYHVDHLGTPHIMTDKTGRPVWRASYEPFGEAYISLQAVENNVRLGGMYADAETGLYYWNSRYYDPKTGRGISPDRMSVAEHVVRWQAGMGMPGQPPLEINPYVYVANNPLRWTDPTGHVIGAGIARILGRILGRTPEESAYGGKILDVGIGAAVGDAPNCVAGTDIRTPRDLLRGAGGASSISLSISTTYGLYGAGATVSSATAAVLVPLFLSGYGGVETGSAISNLYEQARGGSGSIGSDIYGIFH
ncbi:MAG: RHS repeat-associated core domain-containing protein [Pseudomonadota bacterium]